MSNFLVLYRKEMGALFLSPVAYVLLMVFFFLNGLIFFTLLEGTGYEVKEAFTLFFEGSLLLAGIPLLWITIILVPSLLTMRLFPEERRQGTLETLLTAPVSDAQVVLAKYLAALSFYFLLWLSAPFYFLVLKALGGRCPPGPFLTGWLGILLAGALFTSLGLLTSTLTSNQIIAAVLSIIGSLFLLFYPWISFFFPGRSLQRIAVHIDLSTHFHYFARGLLDTGILFYTVSLAAFFLFLSMRIIEARRWKV